MAYTEVLYCIAHELRLHVKEEKAGRTPQYARQKVYLPCMDQTVDVGGIIGMNDWVELYTEEGIKLSGNWILKAKEDGDEAYNLSLIHIWISYRSAGDGRKRERHTVIVGH